MKFAKFFTVALALASMSLFTTSCGDDGAPDGCVRCILSAPVVADCVIDVCEDASTDVGGATLCVGALTTGSTQAEIVSNLETQGFNCN